jgi:DNA-binding NtrC family response regulator
MRPVQPESPLGDRKQNKTILVLEDEPSNSRAFCAALETAGYTVITASDPEEAVRKWIQHDGPVHLLVSDVVLPATSGARIAQDLSSKNPGFPVLLVSGSPLDQLADWGFIEDASLEPDIYFLLKPLTPAALFASVEEALEKATTALRPELASELSSSIRSGRFAPGNSREVETAKRPENRARTELGSHFHGR